MAWRWYGWSWINLSSPHPAFSVGPVLAQSGPTLEGCRWCWWIAAAQEAQICIAVSMMDPYHILIAQFITLSCVSNYHTNKRLTEDYLPIGFNDENTFPETLSEQYKWFLQHGMIIPQFCNWLLGTFVTPLSPTHICNMSINVQLSGVCASTHVQWRDKYNVLPELKLPLEFDGVRNKDEEYWSCC